MSNAVVSCICKTMSFYAERYKNHWFRFSLRRLVTLDDAIFLIQERLVNNCNRHVIKPILKRQFQFAQSPRICQLSHEHEFDCIWKTESTYLIPLMWCFSASLNLIWTLFLPSAQMFVWHLSSHTNWTKAQKGRSREWERIKDETAILLRFLSAFDFYCGWDHVWRVDH